MMRGCCTRLRDNRAIINSNGGMTLCDNAYNSEERFVGELYLGNIRNQTIYEIWNSGRRQHLLDLEAAQRLNEVDLCRNCFDFDIDRPTIVGSGKACSAPVRK